jgi:predicted enzyme related to lactoylglutathione lyase
MNASRTYPPGVPSWVETTQPDLDVARRFYGELLGWTFETVTPPDAADEYVIAKLDGRDVAGLAISGGASAWHTYMAVDDADACAAKVTKAGGSVLSEPADAGPAGRAAICADPSGAQFRLWQAGKRLGAQAVNEPGAWNFSDLYTPHPALGIAFYSDVFGWVFDDVGFGIMVRVPGYGDHLQATIDPEIHARQGTVQAPPGFADAVGWLVPLEAEEAPHWHVTFTIADRDDAVAAARRLGGEVVSIDDSDWTSTALLRDPSGATFTASQFTPSTG